jgi:hypothetical protein
MKPRDSLDPSVARLVTGVAAAASLAIALALPVSGYRSARDALLAEMRAAAKLASNVTSDVAMRNPDLWPFENVRIRGLLSQLGPLAEGERRMVFDGGASLVAEQGEEPAAPHLVVTEPVYDSGVPVGRVAIVRSLRSLIASTAQAAGAGGAVARCWSRLSWADTTSPRWNGWRCWNRATAIPSGWRPPPRNSSPRHRRSPQWATRFGPSGRMRCVMPSPENSADMGAIAPSRDAPAGWAAFRALRQRPAPIPPRRHGNHRHGRYAKSTADARRRFRLWARWLRGGEVGEAVPGLPPPEHPGWWRYRERRRFMPLEPAASHI